jgi:hypothetical protein
VPKQKRLATSIASRSVEARGIGPPAEKSQLLKLQLDTPTAPAKIARPFAHDSENSPEPTPPPATPTAPTPMPAPSTVAAPPASPATDPDLARIVAAWPELPQAIRRAVLALVESRQ